MKPPIRALSVEVEDIVMRTLAEKSQIMGPSFYVKQHRVVYRIRKELRESVDNDSPGWDISVPALLWSHEVVSIPSSRMQSVTQSNTNALSLCHRSVIVCRADWVWVIYRLICKAFINRHKSAN